MKMFFYGLFMDSSLLAKQGFVPRVLALARLDGYVLRIGKRAALVPEPGGRCFGVVVELEPTEVDKLYSEPSVSDYKPHSVSVSLWVGGEVGESIEAVCYNLPPESIGATVNRTYVTNLAKVATVLHLPAEYIQEVKALSD